MVIVNGRLLISISYMWDLSKQQYGYITLINVGKKDSLVTRETPGYMYTYIWLLIITLIHT